MLALTRHQDESLRIGDDIKITFLNIGKNQIRLEINAPENVTIKSEEVVREINEGNVLSSNSG